MIIQHSTTAILLQKYTYLFSQNVKITHSKIILSYFFTKNFQKSNI